MTEIDTTNPDAPRKRHVCPVWVGWLLISPLRRFVENPTKIFGPYVTSGATVVDVGTAMGFHSLDLARLVGPRGRVVCLDIQQKMLDRLVKRARRKGVDNVVEARLCTQDGLQIGDLSGTAELVVAFNVIHEAAHPDRFLGECAEVLKPGGRLMIAEPRGHVSKTDFAETTAIIQSLGLEPRSAPTIRKSLTALFKRP